MIDRPDESASQDYSCEIVSFVVLLGLSALSHFWFIALAIAMGIAAWALVKLVRQLVLCASRTRIIRAAAMQSAVEQDPPRPIWTSGVSTAQNTPEPGLLESRLPSTMCAMSRNHSLNE